MGKEKIQKPQGLTREQLQAQLDQIEGQKIQFLQNKILLEFDEKNYKETLMRKTRENNRNLKLVESNLRVIKKQMSKLR